MKKTAIIYLIIAMAMLFGCRKDGEPITLSPSSVVMQTGDTVLLRAYPQERYQWSSSNNFAVDVSSTGLIRAKFTGESRVKAITTDGRNAWCSIKVIPRLNYFDEPLLNAGAHWREISAAEKREATLESATLFIYNDTNQKVKRLYYLFGDNGLKAAGIELQRNSMSIEELDSFIAERYQYITLIDGQKVYHGHNVDLAIEELDDLWIIRYFF